MIPGYKYMIKRESGFKFKLYPNNSNDQPIGESISYSTRNECIDALKSFRNIIKMNNASSFLFVKEEQVKKYQPQIIYEGKILFLREKARKLNL